jgi:hypothetical protein
MTMVDPTTWKAAFASHPDSERASAYLIEETGTGKRRLLDTRARIVYPPAPQEELDAAGQWYEVGGATDLDELLADVTVCDDAQAVRDALGPPKPSSLSTPLASSGRWLLAEELKLHRNHDLFPGDGSPEQLDLIRLVQELKPSISVTIYIDPGAEDDGHFRRWLTYADSMQPGAQWALRPSDSVTIALPLGTHRETLARWVKQNIQQADIPPHIVENCHVVDGVTRASRYWHVSSFSDIVYHAPSISPSHLPADLWAGRSNAIVVPPRLSYSVEVMQRLADLTRSTVFLSEPSARRMWQAFSENAHLDRLLDCIRRLRLHLLSATRKEPDVRFVRSELVAFITTVAAAGLPRNMGPDLYTLIEDDKELASGPDLGLPAAVAPILLGGEGRRDSSVKR